MPNLPTNQRLNELGGADLAARQQHDDGQPRHGAVCGEGGRGVARRGAGDAAHHVEEEHAQPPEGDALEAARRQLDEFVRQAPVEGMLLQRVQQHRDVPRSIGSHAGLAVGCLLHGD